ncbi:hypothetical protein BGZ63DRAFT_459273 [Mariannaea sp. PMI_226]|nr:hypothetical protein BGZ63DRAFT_459273 [Mariannaea sp. PMI_226]
MACSTKTKGVKDGSRHAVKALPASWYISQDMFELEKRSIFYKRWLLTTHNYRVPENGNWQKYQMIDYHFVVYRDNEGQIKAAHSTKDVEEFDVTKPGSPVHVHVDSRGFIWTNLDKSETPVAWLDHFEGADTQERLDQYAWESYSYDHTWEMEGTYNWKLLGDNYNECYHCRVAHPDLNSDLVDINTYKVVPHNSSLLHYGSPTPEMIAKGLLISPTYFFPNASVNVARNFFMMQRFIPVTRERSIMRYEVYRNKDASEADFRQVSDMYKRVMTEDKFLALGAQENMKRGVYISGELHSEFEKGAVWFQNNVRQCVKEHFELEQAAGRQIWPIGQSAAVPQPLEAAFQRLEVDSTPAVAVA